MAHHPKIYKTSNELILPREIRYTTSKEIGVVEKKRPKLKHPLRTRTRKHTNTARLVGKRGNIQEKRTDNAIRIPKTQNTELNLTKLLLLKTLYRSPITSKTLLLLKTRNRITFPASTFSRMPLA